MPDRGPAEASTIVRTRAVGHLLLDALDEGAGHVQAELAGASFMKARAVITFAAVLLMTVGGSSVASTAGKDSGSIGMLSWLAGVWQSEPRDDAQSEYVYVPLYNGVMVSTNFSTKDGTPTRYELRIIKCENGQVVFRELGFKPDLTAAGSVPERPLQSADARQLTFTDMKITRTGPNVATLELTIHAPGSVAPRTITLRLHRVFRFAKVG
jgi:Domain of unknown function (DUF6265)